MKKQEKRQMSSSTPANEDKRLAPFRQIVETLAPYPVANYHHLIPTAFQESSDLFRPAASIVRVNPEDPRDVYPTPGGAATVCLHSTALERIGNAMGIDWDDPHFDHDHSAEPFVCQAFVSGWVMDSLGQRRRLSASAKSDLREGSITANVLKGGLTTARQFICERTESRARNRAIRKIGNLASSYSKAELAKPFVAIRFRLDERDPEVRAALISAGTRATDEVYGKKALKEGPPIDAGRAEPADEILEGQVTTSDEGRKQEPREPDVVAIEDPAPAEKKSEAIKKHVEQIRLELKWSDAARKKPPTDPQIGLVAGTIGWVYGKTLDDPGKKLLRRAVLSFLWGDFTDYLELSNDRVSATIEWGKTFPAELRELVAELVNEREDLAPVRELLASQSTLPGIA